MPNLDFVEHTDTHIKGFFYEYRFLSNMWECPILWHNLAFTSTEAAYQASKFNIDIAKKFTQYSPKIAKQESKNYTARKKWESIKYDVMSQLVFQKFLVHKDLRQKLLDTGDKYLEETNYWRDQYWGVCNNVGENNLGKILMQTRNYFKISQFQ